MSEAEDPWKRETKVLQQNEKQHKVCWSLISSREVFADLNICSDLHECLTSTVSLTAEGMIKENSQLCSDPWAISICFSAIRFQSDGENEKICKATSSNSVCSHA